MLEFLKNELKKQNNLELGLINISKNDDIKKLSQLVSKQKRLLESLIFEIEYSPFAQSFPGVQTKISTYYNDYFQQQTLFAARGFRNYLPDINPLQIEMQKSNPRELHFQSQASYVLTPLSNPQQREPVNNVSREITPKPQVSNRLNVSNSQSFFASKQEQEKQDDFLIPSKDIYRKDKKSASTRKDLKTSWGLEKQQLTTSESDKKSKPIDKKEKNRNASKIFRQRQVEYTNNLNDKVDALKFEEQELIHKIESLRMENDDLRKKQQYLRNYLLNSLTPKASDTTEEPIRNNQFNI